MGQSGFFFGKEKPYRKINKMMISNLRNSSHSFSPSTAKFEGVSAMGEAK